MNDAEEVSATHDDASLALPLPFTGRWRVENSPSRRVPSHGTDLLGLRYAIDFVGVDDRHRTSPVRDWRTLMATEPPERFVAFGRPVLSPVDGVVVAAHDGEPDHAARRSQFTLAAYALGQASRLRRGMAAVAGNHVMIRDRATGWIVTLVHLRADSLRVRVGDDVTAGHAVAECGNSGNSTQPHLHLQVTDRADVGSARAVPVRFRDFREWTRRGAGPQERRVGLPGERSVVEPLGS